jgi:hypothetical protein
MPGVGQLSFPDLPNGDLPERSQPHGGVGYTLNYLRLHLLPRLHFQITELVDGLHS